MRTADEPVFPAPKHSKTRNMATYTLDVHEVAVWRTVGRKNEPREGVLQLWAAGHLRYQALKLVLSDFGLVRGVQQVNGQRLL